MASRTPSPPPLAVPTNTPFPSRPQTSSGTPVSEYPPSALSTPLYTLPSIVNALLPKSHLSQPPARPINGAMSAAIAGLQLHPTLEASLHLLNEDLASAHFLVRHMSGPPAVEGMLLHSILHRTEGDFANARAWLSDVLDACAGWVPKHRDKEKLAKEVREQMGVKRGKMNLIAFVYEEEGDDAMEMIDDVEKFRAGKGEHMAVDGGDTGAGNKGADGQDEEEVELEERIRRELERVVEWCRRRFGEERYEDASQAWVRPSDEVRDMGNDMVTGDMGWRKY